MKVNYKKLNENALTPTRAHANDAGLDLYVSAVEWITPMKQKCHSHIAFEIPQGYVGLLFPRSSVSNTDMQMSNSVGVIDSDFRGGVSGVFNVVGNSPKPYKVGDRFAQLIIIPYPQVELHEIDELQTTERGTGGYGSTGK